MARVALWARAVTGGHEATATLTEGWRWQKLRSALSVLGLVFLVVIMLMPSGPNLLHGYDLFAYWSVSPEHPYVLTDGLGGQGVFRYAPPVALLMAPLKLLSFGLVQFLWMVGQLACLWFVGRRWALALILFPPVLMDLAFGNVNIFLAAMIVAGFRQPGVWSLALLTKVTPVVGLIWFLVRREWRPLAITLGVAAAIALASVAIQGAGIWGEWIAVLSWSAGTDAAQQSLGIPLVLRVAAAAVLIGYAGLTGRRWLLPIGVVLAMPVLWAVAFTPLVACLPLARVAEDVNAATTSRHTRRRIT